MKLDGAVALVTGATRGVGRALAVELARAGADIIIAGRTAAPGGRLAGSLDETGDAIGAQGRASYPVAGDLNVTDDVERLADEALAWRGRVDVLVNNAAFLGRAAYDSLDDLSLVNWERQISVNLTAPFLLTKLLAPSMRAQRSGAIVNLVSAAGDLFEGTLPGLVYGPSKAALSRLTLALSRELGPSGVTVFAVEPGYVRTEIAEQAAAASNMNIDDAHPPETPARAIVELLERPGSDVAGRIFGVETDRPPILLHDGRGPRRT
jgi:NAD(P)-dependent dehydrogenase (short-subunit alcohol dehydrogenase family)